MPFIFERHFFEIFKIRSSHHSGWYALRSHQKKADHKSYDHIDGAASTKGYKLVDLQQPAGEIEHLVQHNRVEQISADAVNIADDDRERDEANHEEGDIEKQISSLKTGHEPQRQVPQSPDHANDQRGLEQREAFI